MKAYDWTVTSATAIEDNEADGYVEQKKLRYQVDEVICTADKCIGKNMIFDCQGHIMGSMHTAWKGRVKEKKRKG